MSKNILIVDDKPEIAKVITIQLSKDYNVHSEARRKHSRSYYIGRKYAGNGRKNIPQAAKSKLHVQFYTRYYFIQPGEQ